MSSMLGLPGMYVACRAQASIYVGAVFGPGSIWPFASLFFVGILFDRSAGHYCWWLPIYSAAATAPCSPKAWRKLETHCHSVPCQLVGSIPV